MKNKLLVFIDIETTGLNMYKDRVTCIGIIAMTVTRQEISTIAISHTQSEKEILLNFWNFIAEMLDSYDVQIITWNGNKFDIPFLETRGQLYNISSMLKYIERLTHKDLKLEFPETVINNVQRRPSLNEIAEFFDLNIAKTGNGLDATYLFKFNKLDELKAYCLQDVEILKQVYFARVK